MMTFPVAADLQHYFSVAACGDLHLPTGARATFAGERLERCSGCGRWGTEHCGVRRVGTTGDPLEWQADLLAIVTGRQERLANGIELLRLMDLSRGVLDTGFTIDGHAISGVLGQWNVTSVGANAVNCYYDADYDAVDPRTLGRPHGVVRLDGPLAGQEWIVWDVQTNDISEDSGGHVAGPFTIRVATPLESTTLTDAATYATIFGYTAYGAPAYPALTAPGAGTVVYGGTTFIDPGHFVDPAAVVARLLRNGPRWCVEQVTPGVAIDAANPGTYLFRNLGFCALDDLAGEPYDNPAGAGIATHLHNLMRGGWGGKIVQWTDALTGLARVALVPGFEVLATRPDLDAMSFEDQATWPAAGPAGGAQGAPETGAGVAVDGELNDTQGRKQIDALAGGTGTVNRYDHSRGAVKRQQTRFSATRRYFPQVQAGAGVQTFEHGTVEWTAIDLTAAGWGSYAGRVKMLRPHDYDATGAFPAPRPVRTVLVEAVTDNGDGTLWLELGHGATTILTSSAELPVNMGGVNVGLPQSWRINNPGAPENTLGDGMAGQIEPGDCVLFEGQTAVDEELRAVRLLIDCVEACTGGYGITNPSPGSGSGEGGEWTIDDDAAWWSGDVAGAAVGIPGDYLRKRDRIRVINENGFIGAAIAAEGLVGLRLSVAREAGLMRPGTVGLSQGNPASLEGDTEITGALVFAAAGLVYLPDALAAGECLIVAAEVLDRNYLGSIQNFWAAWVRALRGVLGVYGFGIEETVAGDGDTYTLEAVYSWTPLTPADWHVDGSGNMVKTTSDATLTYNRYSSTASSSQAGTVYGEDPAVSCLTSYSNLIAFFSSAALRRVFLESSSITAAFATLGVGGFAYARARVDWLWSDTPIGSTHVWVAEQGQYWCEVYSNPDPGATLEVQVGLLAVTYDGDGKPVYQQLATGTATAPAGESAFEVKANLLEWVQAVMDHRNDAVHFALWLAAGDFSVPPGATAGPAFMEALQAGTWTRSVERIDGRYFGYVEAVTLGWEVATLTGGAAAIDANTASLPAW